MTSRYMLPYQSINYVANCFSMNTEMVPDQCFGQAAGILGANQSHRVIGEFCHAVPFSSWMQFRMSAGSALVSNRCASFVDHICRVVFGGAQKEMGWVYAGPHVTVMTNLQTFWDRSVRQFVRESMRAVRRLAKCDLSVTVGVEASEPQPTAVSFFNLVPKSIGVVASGCGPTLIRAEAVRRSVIASHGTATFAMADNLWSHVTSLGSLVRGAVGADYTVAPRLLYSALIAVEVVQ